MSRERMWYVAIMWYVVSRMALIVATESAARDASARTTPRSEPPKTHARVSYISYCTYNSVGNGVARLYVYGRVVGVVALKTIVQEISRLSPGFGSGLPRSLGSRLGRIRFRQTSFGFSLLFRLLTPVSSLFFCSFLHTIPPPPPPRVCLSVYPRCRGDFIHSSGRRTAKRRTSGPPQSSHSPSPTQEGQEQARKEEEEAPAVNATGPPRCCRQRRRRRRRWRRRRLDLTIDRPITSYLSTCRRSITPSPVRRRRKDKE